VSGRPERVAGLLRRELADILRVEVEPELPSLISLTDVEVSRDLSHAQVYISVLEIDKAPEVMRMLGDATGQIRHELAGRVRLRIVPTLKFIHDTMLERGRIDATEHAVYAAMPLEFDLLERGEPQACLDEIAALLAGSQIQRALSGLLGDSDEVEAPIGWGTPELSTSWGVRPPLPDWVPEEPPEQEFAGGERLEPDEGLDEDWMAPSEPIDRDPANSDAPGQPAMDEARDFD
jgi:ribosome-binding factor A